MTKTKWLRTAERICGRYRQAGILPQTAAAEALQVLLDSWAGSLDEGISSTVVVHDLREVASVLELIHGELTLILPNILEELAEL